MNITISLESFSKEDYHARRLTPGEAVKRNIKYLVIGRPIRNPGGGRTKKQVLQEIRQDIKDTLGKET
jgi:orotidine-5'-phosphate decarboxylase